MEMLKEVIEGIKPLDRWAMKEARERIDNLTKPVGSLGKLEEIAVRLSGITGKVYPRVDKKAVIVMAADNGVCSEGVTAYPPEVTAIIARCMVEGIAGVSVFSKLCGARVRVIDIGMKEDVPGKGIENRKIMKGTGNIARGPAMTRYQAVKAIETGIKVAFESADMGDNIIATGEVGIGNTTTSSAVFAALEGLPPEEVTGRGAGLDDEGLQRKIRVIRKAIELNKPDSKDAIDVINKVGGLDIAGLVGIYLGAAYRRIPVVVDGYISSVAALAAAKIAPLCREYMLPSHISAEKGGSLVAQRLGLEPFLNMNMRLGEGSGAVLAFHMIEAATWMIREMKTFDDIGIKRAE